MKRYTVVGVTLSLALFSSAVLAAPNVVNTTQKGSLVVFPEIDVDGSRNTIIRLTNDNTSRINVKCYYGEFTDDIYNKPTRDFQFKLTKNQPAYWEVKDGTGTVTIPDFPTEGSKNAGQLICWAVSKGGGTQVKWNHLSGMATIINVDDRTSYTYNAYQFYARGVKNRQQVGDTAGVLELNGTRDGGAYDKCGRYIIGHFSPQDAIIDLPDSDIAVIDNFLSISSCTQDLSPVGNAKPLGPDSADPFNCDDDPSTPAPSCGHTIVFDIWNEDEVKFTGAREKADSWWRMVLGGTENNYSEIDVADENFTLDALQTVSAYFRAQSENGYGLMGVLVTDYDDAAGTIDVDHSAVTVNHAGNRKGAINWRIQDDEPPEKM
jgi:hypothetical protein